MVKIVESMSTFEFFKFLPHFPVWRSVPQGHYANQKYWLKKEIPQADLYYELKCTI